MVPQRNLWVEIPRFVESDKFLFKTMQLSCFLLLSENPTGFRCTLISRPSFLGRGWALAKRVTEFVRYLSDTPMRPKITHIHYITRTEERMSYDETERQFRLFLEGRLPAGMSLGFYLVLPALLDDRFVLSDRGGIQFGRGLDEGPGDVLITRLGDQT